MKIGYACKTTGDTPAETKQLNFRSTKLGYVQNLPPIERICHIGDIVTHNLDALDRIIQVNATKPPELRMFRMGCDILPLLDHPISRDYYTITRYGDFIVSRLARAGEEARRIGLRLSFHPSQFVVIASPTTEVATRGIKTIECYTEVAGYMGYTDWHQDGFAINIHCGSGSNTISNIMQGLRRLSTRARNLITLENDEFSWGLQEMSHLDRYVAIVPDLHHYWVKEGNYLDYDSEIMQRVISSWRGVRPKLHLAMSRQHLIENYVANNELPSLPTLLERGLTKSKLRAHSDTPWNTAVLDYARPFADRFDIMWEGKDKDNGQRVIYDYFTGTNAS